MFYGRCSELLRPAALDNKLVRRVQLYHSMFHSYRSEPLPGRGATDSNYFLSSPSIRSSILMYVTRENDFEGIHMRVTRPIF